MEVKKELTVSQLLTLWSAQLNTVIFLATEGEGGAVMYAWNINKKDRKKSVRLKTFSASLSKITKPRNGVKILMNSCWGGDVLKELLDS